MSHEQLIQKIQVFGRAAMEHRQIGRRLRTLLPERLAEIVQSKKQEKGSVAAAERSALTSSDYLTFVEEVVNLSGEARASRVQYETHMMLLDARRSLRKPLQS